MIALRAFVWMVTAQALFACMALGARFVGKDIPWQEIAASRMLVALVLTWAIARARGRSLVIVDRKLAWLRTVFGTLAAGSTFYAYGKPSLPLGDAVTVLNTSPVFVALLAWPLLGERVPRAVAIAIAVSFAGVVAVAQPSLSASSGMVGVCVFSAVCTAFAMMYLRRMGPGETGEAIVFHFMTFGTLVLGLLSVPVFRVPDGRSLAFLLFTGLTGGLAQLAMTRAYSLDGAARVAAVGYAGVVFTRLFAFPAFGEVPSAAQLAGSALVVGAGVTLAMRRRA